MKVLTTAIFGLLALGTAWPLALAREPEPAEGPPAEMLLVRIRAAGDGSVLDVQFVNTARGNLVHTPVSWPRPIRNGTEGQPPMALDWEKVVTENLVHLRKEQGLGEETDVRVAADAHLDFGTALEAVACCRNAGFTRVDFIDLDAGRFVIEVGVDGTLTVGGHTVSETEVKTLLQEMARVARGPDKVEVAVRAHPRAKFATVFRLLKVLKEGGYRATEVSSGGTTTPR